MMMMVMIIVMMMVMNGDNRDYENLIVMVIASYMLNRIV